MEHIFFLPQFFLILSCRRANIGKKILKEAVRFFSFFLRFASIPFPYQNQVAHSLKKSLDFLVSFSSFKNLSRRNTLGGPILPLFKFKRCSLLFSSLLKKKSLSSRDTFQETPILVFFFIFLRKKNE